jgi:mycothiol system anti-sigma-R factor
MSFLDRLKRLLGGNGSATHASCEGDEGECSCRDISCLEALEMVHEYLDGELDAVSHEEVAHHFEVCRKCYPHLRLEERFKGALRRSQAKETCPEEVKAQVLELLAAETREGE